ncbi:TetR/AcrR family transcriptional regulator [Frigidibacter sp.]|uniref:TetR/AcrR family transcriptional regulator n=1 Tax=Frigidibacter sp. TaxID=2586418 RepID=UPI0027341AC1|nr:TetR/AcrR family transcriptional regulator [Frigidibacter sp.]MDP3342254.1 TetR/AcrR family transcriptional regulator [Frigidibacter sp.]
MRKSAEDRKAEIVATMLSLADELGPDRLTTLAVAKAVGVTQPGIFRHFPTKQDLWLAVAAQIAQTMTSAWEVVLEADAPPKDRVTDLITVQLRQITAHPAIPAILHSRELHTENAALRAQFIALMTQFQTLLVDALTEGRAQGVFRADLVPKDAAILLISLVQGLALRWSLGQRAFSLETEGGRLLACQIDLFRPQAPETMT